MTSLSSLLNQLNELEADALTKLGALGSATDVEALRVDWLGKKGQLTALMKGLGDLKADERPAAGSRANEIRNNLSGRLDALIFDLKNKELLAKLNAEKIDVTLPGRVRKGEFEHPVHIAEDELVAIFAGCGFFTEIGPEVEHEFYNFDALNIPPHHPSRTLQDTFYIKDADRVLLRTHTSTVQIRTMLAQKPPIRSISPGRVYRADYDATHTPMFHQIEGLLVDKNIHMGDLKGILAHMVNAFFGTALKVRLRPSFFPFTEPSAEIDLECCFCGGKGCRVCKRSGWIEIGGSGMIDPEVFRAVGIDVDVHRGFAFGMGIERMAMLKYGIDDLRAFFESDHRFVSQFARWRP